LIAHRGTVKEGKIFNGDTVLMKMSKSIYGGMIKANLIRSNAMINSKNARRTARQLAGTVVTTGRQPTYERDKVEFFEPSDGEVRDVLPESSPVITTSGKPDKVFETL
jgi:hypothetical protein